MQEMAFTPEQVVAEVYLIFRVFNLGRTNMSVKIYANPERHLEFRQRAWSVRPLRSYY
jgi:hypothetical protein